MHAGSIARVLGVVVAALVVAGAEARGQTEQNVTVTIRPSQTAEEKVAGEFKEKALRKEAEERLAAEESARIAETSPRALLRRARTIYVESGTSFFEPVQLEDALRDRAEMDTWGMALVDGYARRAVADVIVEIDRPVFTYTFTYRVTHRERGVVLATGKVTAFDGNDAAPKLAKKIVEEFKKARGETKAKS